MGRTDHRTICGLCGVRTRYIGSHVLHVHLPFIAPREQVDATLAEERAARRLAASR